MHPSWFSSKKLTLSGVGVHRPLTKPWFQRVHRPLTEPWFQINNVLQIGIYPLLHATSISFLLKRRLAYRRWSSERNAKSQNRNLLLGRRVRAVREALGRRGDGHWILLGSLLIPISDCEARLSAQADGGAKWTHICFTTHFAPCIFAIGWLRGFKHSRGRQWAERWVVEENWICLEVNVSFAKEMKALLQDVRETLLSSPLLTNASKNNVKKASELSSGILF